MCCLTHVLWLRDIAALLMAGPGALILTAGHVDSGAKGSVVLAVE